MKKYVTLIFFLIIISGIFFGSGAEASVKERSTEIEVRFSLDGKQPISEPILPLENFEPIYQPKSVGKLPSTGDLITSLIWTLLGFSVIIVFVGVVSLKNIMLKIV